MIQTALLGNRSFGIFAIILLYFAIFPPQNATSSTLEQCPTQVCSLYIRDKPIVDSMVLNLAYDITRTHSDPNKQPYFSPIELPFHIYVSNSSLGMESFLSELKFLFQLEANVPLATTDSAEYAHLRLAIDQSVHVCYVQRFGLSQITCPPVLSSADRYLIVFQILRAMGIYLDIVTEAHNTAPEFAGDFSNGTLDPIELMLIRVLYFTNDGPIMTDLDFMGFVTEGTIGVRRFCLHGKECHFNRPGNIIRP